MTKKGTLLSIFEEEIYQTLWKGEDAKEYLIDFLNSYFHFSGEDEIQDLEVISPDRFTKTHEVKSRIHVSFYQGKQTYYYEIKLTEENHTKKFDASFLDFATYAYHEPSKTKMIGQIVLEFNPSYDGAPISHYYLRNDRLEALEDDFDIHIINLPLLNRILKDKSIEELNRFERWILIFMTDDFEYGKVVAADYTPMLSFLHLWHQISRRYQTYENEKDVVIRDLAQKMLENGISISLVCRITSLSVEEVLALKKSS